MDLKTFAIIESGSEEARGRSMAGAQANRMKIGLVYRLRAPMGKPLYHALLLLLLLLLSSVAPAQESLKDYMDRAISLYNEGEYEAALVPALKALNKAEETNSKWLSYCAWTTGNIYCDMGKLKQGRECFRQSLAADEELYGPGHLQTAKSLDSLATVLKILGEYREAEGLYKRGVEIQEKQNGPTHPETANALNALGNLYLKTGDYKLALPLFERTLNIRKKTLGESHPDTAIAENSLGVLYTGLGQPKKALPLLESALSKVREHSPDGVGVIAYLDNLAGVNLDLGSYDKAEELYVESLRRAEKYFGPEHAKVAIGVNNLGMCYRKKGRYEEALPLLKRGLRLNLQHFGPDHPSSATGYTNLGLLFRDLGDFRAASENYHKSLAISERVFGSESFKTATDYNNLGGLYKDMGDFERARQLFEKALKNTEKDLGPDHPETARALNSLATVVELSEGGALYKRALEIQRKALGPNHIETARALNNLAYWYLLNAEFVLAQELLEQALEIRERELGTHISVAGTLGLLGSSYISTDQLGRAKDAFERCLEITQELLGPTNPETTQYNQALATTEFLQGNYKESLEQELRSLKVDEEQILPNILSFTSEQQRLKFQRGRRPYDLLATLAELPSVRAEVTPHIARTVLRHKGLTLDSLLEDMRLARESHNPSHRKLVEQLKIARDQVARNMLEGTADKAASAKVEELERKIASTGADLGRPRRALNVTLKEVQQSLPQDSVLIEFLRFGKRVSNSAQSWSYGAAVISSDSVAWVSLGEAKTIEKELKAYRKAARRYSNRSTQRTTRALYDTLWQPLLSEFPTDTKTVIISPDGQLNFLSFATLLSPDDRLLAQDYTVTYVTSGRDLLKQFKKQASLKNAVIVGNPNFDAKGKGQSAFAPLPGTFTECVALKKMFEDSGLNVELKLDEEATEKALQRLNSPGVLHLATHGFFLSNATFRQSGTRASRPIVQAREQEDVVEVNPMERSGLALAGANSSISAWSNGAPRRGLDGLLTAQEAGGLSLDGTWLVTLSACETGVGEARPGEGVMGLRRGFSQAGARHVLMTLWPVADEETAQFMQEFYKAALGSQPTRAMAHTQREWLVRLRKEQGLAAAVNLAGPFVLTFQGKL